jgi:hypothetical protein
VSFNYPSAPPPPEPVFDPGPPAPREIRPVVAPLLANLALSAALTIAVLIARHSVIDYQLAHHHYDTADARSTARTSLTIGLWSRVGGNILLSVIYYFLVRALLRGRRWAYRRVILLSIIGIVGLLVTLVTPYPLWMHIEQVLQAAVLAGLLFFVTRPAVRGHFAKDLPGRTTRRFRAG